MKTTTLQNYNIVCGLIKQTSERKGATLEIVYNGCILITIWTNWQQKFSFPLYCYLATG